MERKPVVSEPYSIRQRARNRTPLPKATVTLRRPKNLPNPPGRPTLMNMLPMLGMALVMGGIGFATSSGSSGTTRALMTVAPMSVMALLTMFVQQYQHRRALAANQAEIGELNRAYQSHVAEIDQRLEAYAEQQRDILVEENPPLDVLIKRARTRAGVLWERQPADDDFLAARIGTAAPPICVEIKVPEDDDDPRLKWALETVDRRRTAPDVPITANLNRLGSVSISGHRIESLYAAFHIIANLVVHHSPDAVHLYIISHRPDADDLWAWARWLPHTAALRGEATRISLRKETDEPVLDALSQLLRQRDDRRKGQSARRAQTEPHVVVVFDQTPELMGHQAVQLLLEHEPTDDQNLLRAAALFIDSAPPQVNALVNSAQGQLSYRETWMGSADQVFITGRSETATTRDMDGLARSLAPLRTEASLTAGRATLPGSVRLVELLDATNPHEIQFDRLYSQEYDPRQVMTFPIGLDVDLKPMLVKLREEGLGGHAHHAMLAGTTGTGKSVLLQSFVLGLALTHPPSHVNFVLADFKSGASELSKLRALPHVVGFASDMEPSLAERFRIALESEMNRRQMLFDRSLELAGTQATNIRTYNRLFPNDPLPHLVLVIDEYARGKMINARLEKTLELITSQGRALGVHLALSTQRPSDFGELRANIGLRLSLRVADKEESRAIFKRDEAFTRLERPGQAYLQVGDDNPFAMFQSARADLAFQTDGTRNIDLVDDFAIYRIAPDGRGRPIYSHKTVSKDKEEQVVVTEADVLVRRAIDYCHEHYPPARIICLPPLPEAKELPLLPLLSEQATYSRWDQGIWSEPEPAERLRLPIGWLDLPASQQQLPYVIDLTERDGNFAVFGPAGSGRLLFLQSLVLGLGLTHSPQDVHLYLLSQSASLSVFEEMPHCGGVIHLAESERLRRLIAFLNRAMGQRRQAMRQERVADMASLRARGGSWPAIVVVLDDYPGFKTDYMEEDEALLKLVANGKTVDIHFILGSPSMNSFKPALRDNMRNRLALAGADAGEIHNQRGVMPLLDLPGRGYAFAHQQLLECQIASPARRDDIKPETAEATEEIRKLVHLMDASWTGPRPEVIRALPAHIRLLDLWAETPEPAAPDELPTAPLGVAYDDLSPFLLELRRLEPVTFAVGPSRSGKTEYLLTLALGAARAAPPSALQIVVIAPRRSHLHGLRALPHVRLATTTAEAAQALQAAIDERQPAPDATSADGSPAPPHLLILVDDAIRLTQDDQLKKLVDQCIALSRENSVNVVLAETGANLMGQMKGQAISAAFIATAFRLMRGVSFSLEQIELQPVNLQFQLKRPFLNIHEKQFGRGRGIVSQSDGHSVVQFATIGTETSDEDEYQQGLDELIAHIARRWPAPTAAPSTALSDAPPISPQSPADPPPHVSIREA